MGVKPEVHLWVTMTDSFMSGWGEAKNKTNKLVFECSSLEEARIVEDNARARGDQKYINICMHKPWYSPSRYYVQFKTKEEYPAWYQAANFRIREAENVRERLSNG